MLSLSVNEAKANVQKSSAGKTKDGNGNVLKASVRKPNGVLET